MIEVRQAQGSPQPEQRDRWWLVVAVGLAVFMAVLDMSVVNVALPVIENEFGTTTSVSEWVVLGYLLPLISLACRAAAGWTRSGGGRRWRSLPAGSPWPASRSGWRPASAS